MNLAIQGWIEPVQPSTRAFHVMTHQVLAQALQFFGVRQEKLWETFQQTSAFADIERYEFDRQIQHLITSDFLTSSSGLLVLGEESEKRFGRKNFFDLYFFGLGQNETWRFFTPVTAVALHSDFHFLLPSTPTS